MYDVAAGTVRQLDNDALSGELAFLPRYREVVYFNTRGALIMQDIESLQQWVIANSLASARPAAQHRVAVWQHAVLSRAAGSRWSRTSGLCGERR